MKGHSRSIRKALEQSFERVQTMAAAESRPAWERLMDRQRENAGGVFEGSEFADPVRVERSMKPLWAAVAAAAIVLAVLIPIAMRRPAAASLEVAARKVHFGETVRSEMFGEVVKLEDGSRIEMKANSELVLERAEDGVRIRLDQGDIVVTAAKQHGHLYVQTKDVTVSVVGTVFYVKAEKEGSRVAVFEGEVHVKQGGKERKLGPGEQVVTNPRMESVPVQEQVAWSREAAAHMAELPQAPTPKERLAFEVITIRPSAAAGPRPVGARGPGGGDLNSRPSAEGCVPDSAGYSAQIDPQRLAVYRVTVLQLVSLAYPSAVINRENPSEDCFVRTSLGLLAGAPEWVKTEMWDLQASIPAGVIAEPSTPNLGGLGGLIASWKQLADPKLHQMLQTLLAERFKVVLRHEAREMPVYLLKQGKDGPKFNGRSPGISFFVGLSPEEERARMQSVPRGTPMWFFGPEGGIQQGGRRENGNSFVIMNAVEISMANFARDFSGKNGRHVINQTGLTGAYSFRFEYSEDGVARPTFEKALEGVGLTLVESKAPLEVWVIDRAEKPSEN